MWTQYCWVCGQLRRETREHEKNHRHQRRQQHQHGWYGKQDKEHGQQLGHWGTVEEQGVGTWHGLRLRHRAPDDHKAEGMGPGIEHVRWLPGHLLQHSIWRDDRWPWSGPWSRGDTSGTVHRGIGTLIGRARLWRYVDLDGRSAEAGWSSRWQTHCQCILGSFGEGVGGERWWWPIRGHARWRRVLRCCWSDSGRQGSWGELGQ